MESQDVDVASLFSTCTFVCEPSTTASVANAAKVSSSSTLMIDSFYLDSAGRVQVFLPLRLKFASREELDKVLELGCIHPMPSNWSSSSDNGPPATNASYSVSVEARVKMTFGASEAVMVTVESVSIESSSISDTDETILCLNVRSDLRVVKQGDIVSSVAGVKLNFEVSAILTKVQATRPTESKDNLSEVAKERLSLAEGLHALYSGRPQESKINSLSSTTTRSASNVITKTKLASPVICQVNLLHAINVSARTMNGPTMGHSWIAVEIQHSNTHPLTVTINNVTIHPAFSQAKTMDGAAIDPAGEIIDMSQNVKWRFLEGSDHVLFPRKICPHEAFSTVLFIKAEEDSMCRTFACPISVAATVEEDAAQKSRGPIPSMETVVQGSWTSAKRATESSDSFRVDYSLPRPDDVVVGEIFSLCLNIHNLSTERKDLKLKVLPRSRIKREAEESKGQGDQDDVVVENLNMLDLVLGNGSSNGDDGNNNLNENQLLAVDDSCILGTVNAKDAAKAEIRFMPLCSGTLPLPYFDLLSVESAKGSAKGKRNSGTSSIFRCMHNLQVSATS